MWTGFGGINLQSSVFKRQKPDGIRRDQKSDPFADFGDDRVRRIHGEKPVRRPADHQPLPVADKADAVDGSGKRRACGGKVDEIHRAHAKLLARR